MLKMQEEEFLYLVEFVRERYGINLTRKWALLEGRLANYLQERGFASFGDYIKSLQTNPSQQELTDFLNRITTNHTYFMREADHFDFFRDQVIPFWEERLNDRDLRVWCAASSSGEEPYTLAMILQDYFGGHARPWDTRLLATDLSLRALEKAWQGYYSQESVQKLPEAWQKRYFTKVDNTRVQVAETIKKQVVFRQFNLMEPIAAKKPYHAIFCRNVMIYFDAPTKEALANRLYDVMAPGGFLFVGHTEALARPTRFRSIMPSVYQKGVENANS